MFADVSIARMTMRHLSKSEIESYLDQAGKAVTTSVGAYQLEGLVVSLHATPERLNDALRSNIELVAPH
jgi:predicted house-cleaning NTP pyrophosphatase (Maf/HAM1 superfamily)